MRFFAAATLSAAVFFAAPAVADAAGTVPRSSLPGAKALDAVEKMQVPSVDVETLLAEDAIKERSGEAHRPRFAVPAEVSMSTGSAGTWETLTDGSRLWRLRISSPGALSLNLALDRFDLPPGAKFWVHDADGAHVRGPYTAKNRNSRGGLWTAVVLGDEIVAELHLPAGKEADLSISSVNRGYRFFADSGDAEAEKRGACNINVVCPEGDPWRDQIRSVARITISGMYVCSGQLINNTAEDDRPLFLTAQHCVEVEDQAASVVAYWNFESPNCDDFAGGNLSANQSGSTWVSSWSLNDGSDFTLVELDESPDSSWNVYFVGWDARDQIPNSTTTIHHPSGDEKSISFDYDPPTTTSYLSSVTSASGTHWRVADWDEATTEGGSSGSCLFDDATGRCIGTLSGGYAACGNDDPDWYGKFSSHWTGGGSSESRLSDYLDPGNTGALFLDGKNAEGAVGDQQTWLIPAVASAPGVDPTYWSSQVSVANASGESRSASLYFVAQNEAWPGTLISGPTTVAANASLYFDDILESLAPAAGLLYVNVDGDGTAVFGRTWTPAVGGGGYGQGQPGVLLSSGSSATELILPMVHSAPGTFRTNVGFAQTSTGAMRVRVQIYSAAGTLLAQRNYTQSAAWRQVNDIFGNMGIGSQTVEGGWIRVTLVSGSPSYWTTYATVIDASTDDPTYILPVEP